MTNPISPSYIDAPPRPSLATCARCRREVLASFTIILCNTNVVLCRTCKQDWLHAPESSRLRAISNSLVGEWFERERSEAYAEKSKEGYGVVAVPVSPRPTVPAVPTAAPTTKPKRKRARK